MVDNVVGVIKAYITRVGEGPMPTELKDDLGTKMREKGASTAQPLEGHADAAGLTLFLDSNPST